MTSISSGSGPRTGPLGESTGGTTATATDRAPESTGTATVRDSAGDAAALARTEAARTEAPGSGMTEGPRLELQQWATRLSDLNRELESLPPGSAEANAKLAEVRTHLGRLAALQARVESGLRSGPAALAQDYLLLLNSSRSALSFLNAHRSDPGSEAFGTESTLIGELQSRRDRSLASLRSLATERLLPGLRVAEGAEPSEQQIGDYRLLLRINGALGEAELETLRLPRELTTAYSAHIHPDTVAAGGELPDFMRSSFFRDLDPHPVRSGTPPEAHSPDAEFPEGHPFRDLYRSLWEHRGSSFSEADANRIIQQLQGLRGELAEGGRYHRHIGESRNALLARDIASLEDLLRNPPRTIPADQFTGMTGGIFHRLGSLEYASRLESSEGTTTRGRIDAYWRMYREFRYLVDDEAQRSCLHEIYRLSQIDLLPANRTNALSEADRHAIAVRVLEAYVDTRRLDVNFASMLGSLGREINRLWTHGTEESRFTALGLWTRYNGLYRRIGERYTEGTVNALGLESPHHLLGTSESGLPALLQEMENRARASNDPNEGAARLILVAQAHASRGDMQTCTDILRSVEGSIAAHPSNEGNPFASRSLILGSFSNAGMAHLLGDYVSGWIASDRAALREARPRDRANLLSETLQDWAAIMSGLAEIGQPGMASQVFAALDAEMAPLTVESRARVYREILPHTSGAQREEILNRVRDLIGSDAERSEPLSMDARVQLNSILGEFSTDPFEIQGAFTALTSIVRHENPSPEMLVEIHRYRLALRNHIHDLVHNHPDTSVEGSPIREMWLWTDGYGGRDGGSNAIVDDLTAARRALMGRLGEARNPGERRRILTLLNDSFREGMRMRLHGNDYGLQALVDQHLEMIRALRPAERPSVFAESLQFLNQMEVDRMRARGRDVTSFRNTYYDTMTAALPSLVADIPAGPERRSAILQFTRVLSQAREVEERRLRAAERALVTVRATTAYHWAVDHGFGERFIGRTEAEDVDALRPAVDSLRQMEIRLWNQFAEGESIPEARRVYEGFARAMSLTVEGRSGEARAAMTAYYSDPEVQAFLRSDPAGDAHRAEAQAQIQQLLDVSATILNGEAGARFDRTLRIVRGLARIRLATLRREGEEFPYDIDTINRMTADLPRFLATLPPDRMPQTFEAALQLFGAANEGNACLVSEYNGAINRIPVQHVGSDGGERTGSVWGLIRAMEHLSEPGGAGRAFAALQAVVADDTDWDLLSREGRGDLGPALQDFCDIIIDEGANVSPELRQSVANFRARIPEEEEFGHFLRQTFNWQLAVDIGLMALSGGVGGMARAAVSRIVIGLAERAALRMATTGAIRFTMMAGRGLAYVGGHVASGVTFNLVHASTSALILNRPMENPFASGLRMSADSMINDPISMMLFSSIPGPSSMVGRFLYRQVATALTFQISQNIRFHAERGARDLLDSDFHRALERRERMRLRYEATGDTYYQEQFEAAERRVTEIIGHEPDNSVRGIMLNIGMNIGQAGADHVMGTHHWAGNFGLEDAPHAAAAERPTAPRTEAERTERRAHSISLADALADTRASRLGTGREGGGTYRNGAEEGPARAAAERRVREEREFFRELADLHLGTEAPAILEGGSRAITNVYDHYSTEALNGLVDHVTRHFDPHGEPPALNEASRRFLRFFLTRVNPDHATRVPPAGLATLVDAALGRARPVERPSSERPAETTPVVAEDRGSGETTRRSADPETLGRVELERPELTDRVRDRESNPEAELSLRLMADEALGETMTHLDDLLRHADPEALRTTEGRARFLREYREAREHLEANPDALGGLRPHEALAALMGRGHDEDLPTAARRLVAGEIRLRPRTEAEHHLLPPGVHAESPLRRLIAEELTARNQAESLREAARTVDHARREIRELTALLRSREGDPRFAAVEAQTRDLRVRLEAAHRRVAEVRGGIRQLRSAERELSRRGLDPERRRELTAEANRLRRDIARRIEGIRDAESGVTRFVAAARALERSIPRPESETAREGIRVEAGRSAESEGPTTARGEESRLRAEPEGPEIEISDEGVRVDLSEETPLADETPADGVEGFPTHLMSPGLSATRTVGRMNTGVMAALGLNALGIASTLPSTVHAQDATHAGHGIVADSAQFLTSFLHLSPLAMTGTAATIALGFGAIYSIFRRASRSRSEERRPTAIREGAAARGRTGGTTRGEADGGGQGRQEGDSSREGASAPELPARLAQPQDSETVAPETSRSRPVETSFEGVLQDNAPGAPRRGALAVREASPDYGTTAGATHEGIGYDDSNEDALVHGVDATGSRYAVVLDGMGGMGSGDHASRLAGEVIQAEMSAHGNLLQAFEAAHEAVRRRYPGAGACAVAHRVFRGTDGRLRMEIVHVGDSGAVVFGRDGRVIYRTRDQSRVQMLADAGLISNDELTMRTHPDLNVVQGGLGPSQSPPPVHHEVVLEGGERLVMFSDGLGDNVATEEMVRRAAESGSAEEAQNSLIGLALQRMGILDSLYPQFDTLPEGARIPFTAPDGRTLYLARDLPESQLQGGVVEMMNVYDAAEGGNLVDHFKADNVAVHVYFHDPAVPASAHTDEAGIVTAPPGEDFGAPPSAPRLGEAPPDAEVYVPTQVPADGAPPPVDLPPPPRFGLAADAAEARTIDLLNRAQTPELRPAARPGEPLELHFPDLAGLMPIGTERIAGAGIINDPRVAPRHAVVERIGPDALLVQNLGEHQTFVVAPDGSYYPVGKYGFVIRSGQEIVMGGTRIRVTAEGRAPDPEAAHHFGYHPFRGQQSFSPNFANGPQEGFGARIHPESGIIPGIGRVYAVESLAETAPISVRENPTDPRSPWRTLAPGERHRLRFEHGVSEEFRNAEGVVSRMTRHGEIIQVRGGEIAREVEAPGSAPIELALGERDRFVIGTRPESDVPLPRYSEANGRILLDPYLHQASSNDPRLRFAPDIPADHAEVFRTPEGEWRIRNLSGAVMEIVGSGEHHFFLPRGAEMTLTEGQTIIFRGENAYRYRFRIPRAHTESAPAVELPRPEVGRRTGPWLDAPDAAALNRRLAEEGVPFRVRSEDGPSNPETAVRALAETPPTLVLRFENGRLTPDSVELLYAFVAMPESLRTRLRSSAQAFDAMLTDLSLAENPLALHHIRASATLFHQRVFQEGVPELAQALARLRPETSADAEAALARLFFWGPENISRESNLLLAGITGNDGFYRMLDPSPQEFPNPVERAQVQARIEAAREEGRRTQAEAELIRARIQEHFRAIEAPGAPALSETGLRGLVGEMLRNARAPEARPAPEIAAVPADGTISNPPRAGRARFRPISEITAEAERISGGLRRGEDPNSERVRDRVTRYRDHLIEQGVEAGEAQVRAETWRERVLGAARARQARVTHIYDTSLPARPETAHLDAATVDHHGRFANERNATEQLLDRCDGALARVRSDASALEAARQDADAMAAALEGTGRTRETATPEDVEVAAAIRALDLREVTTDNLADGGWSVWIARNQARVLRDPQLRALIESATHFEDFTAFGTAYSEATPGVRLQAALFQGYGEILRRQGIRGSDRFSPLQANEVMGQAMALIDGLLVDPARREAEAQEFFQRVEAARTIAAERGIIAEASVHEGDTRMTFFDLRALSDFTVFQQWLALPRVSGPDGAPDALQVSVVPMPPARTGAGGEAPRTLQIVAIPNGRALPSGRGLLSALERVNAAERERARELGVEPANVWFGKDNVILANPAGGGTLLRPAELAAILRDPTLALFESPTQARIISNVRAAEPQPAIASSDSERVSTSTTEEISISPEDMQRIDVRARFTNLRQRLIEAAQHFRIRSSPAVMEAIDAFRNAETIENPVLLGRLEILVEIFSDPRLRISIALFEARAPGSREGSLARDILLGVYTGEISSIDQALTHLEGETPASLEVDRHLSQHPALERTLRHRAESFAERYLPFVRNNPMLRAFAVQTMVNRYRSELLRAPELQRHLETLHTLRQNLPSSPAEPAVIAHAIARVYQQILSHLIRSGESWSADGELRETSELIAAELQNFRHQLDSLDASRPIETLDSGLMEDADIHPEDLVVIDESVEIAETEVSTDARPHEEPPTVEERVPVQRDQPTQNINLRRRANQGIATTEATHMAEAVEERSYPETFLPTAVENFIRENFSDLENRRVAVETAWRNRPILSEAIERSGLHPDTPEARWILGRLLVETIRTGAEIPADPSLRTGTLSPEALAARILTEHTLFQSVEALGFDPSSQEGSRLAAFLNQHFVRGARSAEEYQSRLALLANSDLREASDRLVLLGEERSLEARRRHLEWAIETRQTPESLGEVFWNALRGVASVRLGDNGVEITSLETGRSPLGETGERVLEILDALHIAPFSAEGSRLANVILAQAAVEARPGTPRFGRLRLEEAIARLQALPQQLQPVLARVPTPSATTRTALFRWALQSQQSAESLARLGETLSLLPEARAESLLQWVVASGQRPEGLALLRETLEAALDLEQPITDLIGIRQLFAERLAETSRRNAVGLPRVGRSSPAHATLERYAFVQGPDTERLTREPDKYGVLRICFTENAARRVRLTEFANPFHQPGPLVNLARRADRALRRLYELAVETERLERESPRDPRIEENIREMTVARQVVETWEDHGLTLYGAATVGQRITNAQHKIWRGLRHAVEPDAETFDAENRPMEANSIQALRDRILAIDESEPNFYELTDAWLDPARGDQGTRPIVTGSMTFVVREARDVGTVMDALAQRVQEIGLFREPQFRVITETSGSRRLEIYERGEPNYRQAIRVIDAETARYERAVEAQRIESNARETPAPLPIPEIRSTEAPVRPTLRVVRGNAGSAEPLSDTRRNAPLSAPVEQDILPLAAAPEEGSIPTIPPLLNPLTVLSHPERRDAFLDSLAALEAAGLLPPGTTLENYQLPGILLNESGPNRAARLSLRPREGEVNNEPHRVESVAEGMVTLRRLGAELEGENPSTVVFGPSHPSIPFQAGDYVYLDSAGPERRATIHPEAPSDGPSGPELPARGVTDPERTQVQSPDPALFRGLGISIPPLRVPDFRYTESRADLELRVINAGLHPSMRDAVHSIEAIASAVAESESGGILADLAILQNREATLEALEPAVQRLSELLRLRREFPEDEFALENFFQERVSALYAREATVSPREGAGQERETVRVGVLRPAEPEPRHISDEALLGQIDSLASRNIEGFSALAQQTREALSRHNATRPDPNDGSATRAWNQTRERILNEYRNESLRLARELVERHEEPGRRLLEFLRGLNQNEALWRELEDSGFERARLAADFPPHGRPKAVEDVLPKIERRGWNSILPFTDLFGTRVVVESYEHAISLVAAIRRNFTVRPEYDRDGRPIANGDRGHRLDHERLSNVLSGRRSGYRALHVVVDVDGLPVEIQIHTRALHRWGNIQHDFYKNDQLSRPENADIREVADRYFAEAAAYLAGHEQGVSGAERPPPPRLSADRLGRLPVEVRQQIFEAIGMMESLIDEETSATRPTIESVRPAVEAEVLPIAAASVELESSLPPPTLAEASRPPSVEATRRSSTPGPEDGGSGLHSSFLGAGLLAMLTMTGHDTGTSLLAGILGTVLPVGVLGVFRWVRGRLGTTQAPASSGPASTPPRLPVGPAVEAPLADFTVSAEDGAEYVFRPYRAEAGNADWRYIASLDRVLPSRREGHFEATFAVVRQAPGEPSSMVTLEIPADQARRMGLINDLGHTQRGTRLFLDRIPAPGTNEAAAPTRPPVERTPAETTPLEAAPPPEVAAPPSPREAPLLQPNIMGGNLAEIDGHLAGELLSEERLGEVLARNSRRANLPGGELVYIATQGIDPRHPVGEDFMGGVEYRDTHGRRVYSMMVADGMGGMGNGDAAAQLSVEAFTAELRRSGDMRRAWELANAAVRLFNRAFAQDRNRAGALDAARAWIRNPSLARPGTGADGGGACSVSFSVIPPTRPEGAYVLQSHFAGDASLRVYRRGPDGRYRRVYATVEQNVGAVAADSRQESGADLRRTREIRLHPLANKVTNGIGTSETLILGSTAEGELPTGNGRVRRATGYEHGLVLQEGDLVLAGSDGFWENFIDTDIVGELIQGTRSAEEAHRILREETHARMEVLNRLRNRELPAAANGRFRFTHRGRELFIDRSGSVYDSETATAPIDKFKPDNFSLAAYLHRPAAIAAESVSPTRVPPTPAPAAMAPSPRRSSVPPPIPEAARRIAPRGPAQRPAIPPAPLAIPGVPVIAEGDHLYRIVRGGARVSDGRFVYQLRLDSISSPEAPTFQEISSPRALEPTEIEAILGGRRPAGVEVREGWGIADLRANEPNAPAVQAGVLPLRWIPSAPGMRGLQIDFYGLNGPNARFENASAHPRVGIIDPTLRSGPAIEPIFSLTGTSDTGSPENRAWILSVHQSRVPVYVDGQALPPGEGLARMLEGTRVRIGLNEFVFRDQSLVPETTVPLRLSVPPLPREPDLLPLAAAPRDSEDDR